MFELPPLPYEPNALEPHISRETIDYHYGKHHKAYVTNLNNLLPGSGFENDTLEEVIKKSDGAIFNNAAQVWNHTFYWHCLTPNSVEPKSGALVDAINKKFGSMDAFKDQFSKVAISTFGSGWAWLVKKKDGSLEIMSTSNAGTPITNPELTPILTCDVWEHAYYIDYRNARPTYVDTFWKLVNWEFMEENFAR